jgi:hypothetical protein
LTRYIYWLASRKAFFGAPTTPGIRGRLKKAWSSQRSTKRTTAFDGAAMWLLEDNTIVLRVCVAASVVGMPPRVIDIPWDPRAVILLRQKDLE